MSKAFIIGRGVIGLTTARALVVQGFSVIVVGEKKLSETTSAGAGGLWMPFHCEPAADVARWSADSYDLYLAENDRECIEVLPALHLFAASQPPPPPVWATKRIKFESVGDHGVEAALRRRGSQAHVPAGYGSAWLWDTVVVDAPRYLQKLEQFLERTDEAKFESGHVRDLDDALKMAFDRECDVLVNCAGLGGPNFSKGDETVGARGVVMQFHRPPGDTVVITTDQGPLALNEHEPAYQIPRGDVVVVGGSYDEGKVGDATEDEIKRISRNANALSGGAVVSLKQTWVGYRPVRPGGVRLEVERHADGTIVAHNYGHGGSGWTVALGCADDLVCMITKEDFYHSDKSPPTAT
ncbi:FAD dependent oxidoreductase [Pelagophyceae sp. CCMP2097]|nr:FAD dependent oxidoreductase [Pelagophyceae sp. CCMP2097]